jgi:hypothetical protein
MHKKTKTKTKTKTKKNQKNQNNQYKLNCGPTKKLKYSCYEPKSIIKMKQAWNSYYPNNQIESNDVFTIWKFITKNLKEKCTNEKCWLFQPFMSAHLDKHLTNFTFAPPSPKEWQKNPNTWLTNHDIEKVLKQYEYKYSSFKLIGPSAIDFDKKLNPNECVYNELCNFNISEYKKKGLTKIGIVLNTDPHTSDGSHWICLFININLQYIYFFDSNGFVVPKEITIFMNRIHEQSKELGTPFKIIINKVEHQKTNTECGMYVLYIIISLLKKDTYPNFKKIIPDSKVESLRKILFN